MTVNPVDELDARHHPHGTFTRVSLTHADSKYDCDKSSKVNPQDEIVARNNPASSLNGLLLLNPAP